MCCNHECDWDVFSVRPSPPIKCIFTPPPPSSWGFYFSPHISVLLLLKLLRLLYFHDGRWCDCTGKEASFMSTQGFLAYLVFQWLAVNLTVSEWEERNSGGSLMIWQHGAILDVLDFYLIVCNVCKYAMPKHYLFLGFDFTKPAGKWLSSQRDSCQPCFILPQDYLTFFYNEDLQQHLETWFQITSNIG